MESLIEEAASEPDPQIFRKVSIPLNPASAAELHTWLAAVGEALSEWRFDRNMVNGFDWDSLPLQLEQEDNSVSQLQLEESIDHMVDLLKVAERNVREAAFFAKTIDEEFFGRLLTK